MCRKGVFAFSGDPITHGHVQLIQRAAQLFTELHVVVLDNSSKQALFGLEHRLSMVKSVLANWNIPNLVITQWDRLLYAYTQLQGITHIVRGIREGDDCSWEFLLEDTYKSHQVQLDFVYMRAESKYRHIRSSWVKSMVQERASVHTMVPWCVKKSLERKILSQVKIGVTGSTGAGKTTIIQKLMEKISIPGVQTYHIDFDSLVHNIYDSGVTGSYQSYLKRVHKLLPDFCFDPETLVIHRVELRTFLYRIGLSRAKKCLDQILNILRIPLENELQIQCYDKKGILFLESAILLEHGLSYLCNGDVLLVEADKETLLDRLAVDDLLPLLSGLAAEKRKYHSELLPYEKGILWQIDTSTGAAVPVDQQIQTVSVELQKNFADWDK